MQLLFVYLIKCGVQNIILILRENAIFILLSLSNDYLYKEYFLDNIILKLYYLLIIYLK